MLQANVLNKARHLEPGLFSLPSDLFMDFSPQITLVNKLQLLFNFQSMTDAVLPRYYILTLNRFNNIDQSKVLSLILVKLITMVPNFIKNQVRLQ